MPPIPIEDLAGALERAYPELATCASDPRESRYIWSAAAVRDLLLGRGRADIDLVVEGDAAGLAARLGADVVEHERFATAKARLDGHEVDIATARTETYSRPGALPEVEPSSLSDDLARRDFTINAMAIPLGWEPVLIDSHGGLDDLLAGLLRVLHRRSFTDDPTRALRAARYAARFGFALEAETAELLGAADLSTVSADRRQAELLRLAGEPEAVRGLELVVEWGLIEPRAEGARLTADVAELLASPLWSEFVERRDVLLAAALGPPGGEAVLAAADPASPSEAVELARGRPPVELALARALGAEWLDRYLAEWRSVSLEIDGARADRRRYPGGSGVGTRPAGGVASQAGWGDRGARAGAGRGAGGRSGRVVTPRSFCFVTPMRWCQSAGVRWLEAELPSARAAFSTRLGGVSGKPFDSLNLGALTDDATDSVIENRRRLATALGFEPGRVVIGRQVHGAELAVHTERQRPSPFAEPGAEIPEVDGHLIAEPGLAALVFVADCLPVALAGPGGVAMLHCGWRGLAAGILAEGAEAVGATHAAIGPGIGPLLL